MQAEKRAPDAGMCIVPFLWKSLWRRKTAGSFFIGMWLSLVERVPWEYEVAGSNPVIPTMASVLTAFEKL